MKFRGICPICVMETDNVGRHIYEAHIQASDCAAGIKRMWGEADGTPNFIRDQAQLNAYFNELATPSAWRCVKFPVGCWWSGTFEATLGDGALCPACSAGTVVNVSPPVTFSAPPALEDDARLAKILGPNIAALLRHDPNDPTLRGLILKRTSVGAKPGCWVPEGEDIVKFVLAWTPPPVAPAPRPAAENNYRFEASYVAQVSGWCRFTANETYSGAVEISEAKLVEMAEDSVSMADFEEQVIEAILETEPDNFECTETDDLGHSDYDTQDSGEREDWQYENLQTMIARFFAAHPDLDPERPAPTPTPVPIPAALAAAIIEDTGEDCEPDDDSDDDDEYSPENPF